MLESGQRGGLCMYHLHSVSRMVGVSVHFYFYFVILVGYVSNYCTLSVGACI